MMITKKELLEQMLAFKENATEQYSLPILTIIATESTVEDAYFLIGQNSSDCKYQYDGIAYREDLYDVLIALGLEDGDAYGIMERVRKGMAQRINFDEFNISLALRDWCLGVRYLPSRKIVHEAINEIANQNDDCEEEFHDALLETLPEYTYSPMTFIGTMEQLDGIRNKVFALSKKKDLQIEEETDFEIRTCDKEFDGVKIITITGDSLCYPPQADIIYKVVLDMILNRMPMVALVENECSYSAIEGRLRALLWSGVVCQMKK